VFANSNKSLDGGVFANLELSETGKRKRYFSAHRVPVCTRTEKPYGIFRTCNALLNYATDDDPETVNTFSSIKQSREYPIPVLRTSVQG
jgi:hypothetical protein